MTRAVADRLSNGNAFLGYVGVQVVATLDNMIDVEFADKVVAPPGRPPRLPARNSRGELLTTQPHALIVWDDSASITVSVYLDTGMGIINDEKRWLLTDIEQVATKLSCRPPQRLVDEITTWLQEP
jgi:hypothetical protein